MKNRALFVVRQGAYIFNTGDELLLLKNRKDKWSIVGGHLEEGENSKESLLREIKEESDLDVEVVGVLSTEAKNNTFFVNYIAKTDSYKIKISEEHKDWKWANLKELENLDLSFSRLKDNAEKALKQLKIISRENEN